MRDRFLPTALAYRIAGDASGIPLPPARSIRATLKHWATKFATRILLAATILGGFGAASTAGAEVISPDAGLDATLNAVAISIYYDPTLTGYQVVITAGTADPYSFVRFVCTLAPGQDAVVSVPRGEGQPALELRLRRVGDRVELQRPVS
jgi:hypothetical protein